MNDSYRVKSLCSQLVSLFHQRTLKRSQIFSRCVYQCRMTNTVGQRNWLYNNFKTYTKNSKTDLT